MEVKGDLEIPNLSEENDPEEIDVQVSLKTESGKMESLVGPALKELLRNKGTKIIREKLATYISELKTDFAKDLILPTKDAKNGDKATSHIKHEGKSQVKSCSTKINGMESTVKENTSQQSLFKSLKVSDSFKCRADELYNLFLIPEMTSAFTRGAASVDAKIGGIFKLFDGNVTGSFTHFESAKCIKQKWRFSTWPKDHYSDVKIIFDQKSDETKMTVEQTGIPYNDYERTENGWKTYYFESIKRTFGFGASLY